VRVVSPHWPSWKNWNGEREVGDPSDVLKFSGKDLDDYYDSFRYGWKSFETAARL
jgi:hypothetical protein